MLSVSLSGQQIVHAEYFIGPDPGYGNATPVAVTAASEVEMSLNIPLSDLDHGLQTLYARVVCSDGQVSQWAGQGLFHTHPLPVNELILDADPPEGGTLSGQGSYPWGETVSIEATPNTHFVFEYWSGDSHYLDDPGVASGTVTMALEPISLTAHFRDATGIAGISERSLRIFPNPARTNFLLRLTTLTAAGQMCGL